MISKNRIKEIKECVKAQIDDIRIETEVKFNQIRHYKSGRSGSHGKKFNMLSTAIIQAHNQVNRGNVGQCFNNVEERKIVDAEFKKISKMNQERGKEINHPNR